MTRKIRRQRTKNSLSLGQHPAWGYCIFSCQICSHILFWLNDKTAKIQFNKAKDARKEDIPFKKKTLQARNSNLTFIHIAHNLGASGEKGNWIYISIKKACCLERRVQSSQVEVWRQSCGKRDKQSGEFMVSQQSMPLTHCHCGQWRWWLKEKN